MIAELRARRDAMSNSVEHESGSDSLTGAGDGLTASIHEGVGEVPTDPAVTPRGGDRNETGVAAPSSERMSR
jgi:hypothetical protein